uniref:Glycosyltransferase n=1 Tax=Leersia perrieri TaxID=77586 RepID=A0A0D9W1D9_9ORYZ
MQQRQAGPLFSSSSSMAPASKAAAVVGEGTARQAASFVVGAVATLTVVLLFQYSTPDYGRAARAPVQFSTSSRDHCAGAGNNGTAKAAPAIAGAGSGEEANVTGKTPTIAPVAKKSKPASSPPTRQSDHHVPSSTHLEEEEEGGEFQGLATAVKRVAMDDKTVIITCVNHAFAAPNSLLDLFLESFRIGDGTPELLRHVLIIAMDPTAFSRCQAVHPHCYLYTMPGIDFTSEKFFASKDYLELVWSKLKLQRRILQLGYNFLFTDVDIVWLRNPFKHVTVYADMAISSDVFFGDPDKIDNFPNTGFFYVKPNARTIEMTKSWHDARSNHPGLNEQPVFNIIKKDLMKKLKIKLQYLDTAYIGGFCNHGKDLSKICTMHANCCIGLASKISDLRGVLDDWKNYTRMPPWAKQNARWTVPEAQDGTLLLVTT